jgi:hypothetical protein
VSSLLRAASRRNDVGTVPRSFLVAIAVAPQLVGFLLLQVNFQDLPVDGELNGVAFALRYLATVQVVDKFDNFSACHRFLHMCGDKGSRISATPHRPAAKVVHQAAMTQGRRLKCHE